MWLVPPGHAEQVKIWHSSVWETGRSRAVLRDTVQEAPAKRARGSAAPAIDGAVMARFG